MIVSIHQPGYFPWLGWLDKVRKSDLFILMDEVQLSDSAYQNRNIFLTQDGQEKYLTIPIRKKGYKEKMLKDLELSDHEDWQAKHRQFLHANYRKHPYYQEVMDVVGGLYEARYTYLGEVLYDSVRMSLEMFGIETKVLLQSGLDYDRNLRKNDLVLALVQAVKADHYLSGQGAKAYMVLEDYDRAGIRLSFQEFTHPVYEQFQQRDGMPFKPGLSCLDVLFNIGITAAPRLFEP
jgi:hypothetical protein